MTLDLPGKVARTRKLVPADLDLGLCARIADTFPLLRWWRPELYRKIAAAPRTL